MTVIDEIVQTLATFLGEDTEVVREKVERELLEKGVTVAEAWRRANPGNVKEVEDFYRTTDAFLYDLLVDHEKAYRREIRGRIMDRLQVRGCKSVLDFGGGAGLDCVAMSKAGLTVTYFELEGLTSRFAEGLFRREGCDVRVLHDSAALPADAFDAVVCVEVLEHVSDPPAVIDELCRCLKSGGVALITESFEEINERYPSHLPSNRKFAGKVFSLMESRGLALTARWPDNKPLEFLKSQSFTQRQVLRWKRRSTILRDLFAKGMRRAALLR